MTEKQYIRSVDHTEKEVRIFDIINEKKIFNIFFNELDSAICLNGALTDVVDLLNKLAEENQHFEYDNKRMVKFIMSKGYGLKDYLDFCKEYEE